MHWNGKIVLLHGNDSFVEVIMINSRSCLKQWHHTLWIWHAFFYIAGSNNGINVLNQSKVFNDILDGHTPTMQCTTNGTPYNMGYYLEDDIYPYLATFVKIISMPRGEKRKHLHNIKNQLEMMRTSIWSASISICKYTWSNACLAHGNPQAYLTCLHLITQHDY